MSSLDTWSLTHGMNLGLYHNTPQYTDTWAMIYCKRSKTRIARFIRSNIVYIWLTAFCTTVISSAESCSTTAEKLAVFVAAHSLKNPSRCDYQVIKQSGSYASTREEKGKINIHACPLWTQGHSSSPRHHCLPAHHRCRTPLRVDQAFQRGKQTRHP